MGKIMSNLNIELMNIKAGLKIEYIRLSDLYPNYFTSFNHFLRVISRAK